MVLIFFQHLNRIPQGNEVQVSIMGNMEMSVFYNVDKDWELIVVWNLQERFVLSTDIHSATIGRKRHTLTIEFGPHYKYAKHPSPIFQSSTLAAAGQFHKMFESSEFSRSLGGNFGFPREKKTHELVNETGETQADAIVNCRQRMPRTCTSSASRFVSPTRVKNSPGVIFPVRLQTSGSLQDDPRSRCPRERESRGRSIEFLNLFANLRY